MAIKQPKTDQQKLFFKVLFETGNKVKAASEAGYAKASMHRLCNEYSDFIKEQASGVVALAAIKAAEVLVDSLDFDGETTLPVAQFKVTSARDILDRQGLGKSERMDFGLEGVIQPVFILPVKDIPAEYDDD